MKRLNQNITSQYIEAANRLNSRTARQKIVAYVESYDDVFVWRSILARFETEKRYFEVMLPSRENRLERGKKAALMSMVSGSTGHNMIACVDADYDYLLQGATPTSAAVCSNPYVFHTYAYAIENLQCYAPALHNLCVMTTLNDHRIFDFEAFLAAYSEVVWPLFVWNIWCYRYDCYKQFSMLDLYHVVQLQQVNLYHPEQTLEHLRHVVNAKMSRLQRAFPQARKTYKPLQRELEGLGVTPETTYLYMRGHDVADGVVMPLLNAVCERLRRERENEIRRLAEHKVQMQNELAAYEHAAGCIDEMLRKHNGFSTCPLYQRVQRNVAALLKRVEEEDAENAQPQGNS